MSTTMKLSDSAVAVLRFEIKGYRAKNNSSRLDAYRELAGAGIMEPVSGSDGDYRFTDEGMRDRAEILERESDRIERERYPPHDDTPLSGPARERLRQYFAGNREATEENRAAFRELVAARIMIPVHTFAEGRESAYRFTYWGWHRRFEFAEIACAKESA